MNSSIIILLAVVILLAKRRRELQGVAGPVRAITWPRLAAWLGVIIAIHVTVLVGMLALNHWKHL